MALPIGERILQSKDSFWEATIRYLVWGTIGCYLIKPSDSNSDTQAATNPEGAPDRQSDNDKAHILRPSAEKLCFPAWPYAFPKIPTFRELTGTQGALYYIVNLIIFELTPFSLPQVSIGMI